MILLGPMMFKHYFPYCTNNAHEVYLDSAATGLKNKEVMDAEYQFAATRYANVHRGVYRLTSDATHDFEAARTVCSDYFHSTRRGCVFVRGATEGINLFAEAVIAPQLEAQHNIVLTLMEHHANILIWKQLCVEKNAELRCARLDAQGRIDWEHLASLVDKDTLLVSVTHASNVTGVINNLEALKSMRDRGIWTLVDGAQLAPHRRVDVAAIMCDAYVVSAHKMYGPSGIGMVMLSEKALDTANNYQLGGGMVARLTDNNVLWQEAPWRFEAGTPHITGAIGFAAAIKWLEHHADAIHAHEAMLSSYFWDSWKKYCGDIPAYGDPLGVGMIAFDIPGIHPHDVATFCDVHHIAVRAGHLCASPLVRALGHDALVRVSLGCYNSVEDIDKCIASIQKLRGRSPHVG